MLIRKKIILSVNVFQFKLQCLYEMLFPPVIFSPGVLVHVLVLGRGLVRYSIIATGEYGSSQISSSSKISYNLIQSSYYQIPDLRIACLKYSAVLQLIHITCEMERHSQTYRDFSGINPLNARHFKTPPSSNTAPPTQATKRAGPKVYLKETRTGSNKCVSDLMLVCAGWGV